MVESSLQSDAGDGTGKHSALPSTIRTLRSPHHRPHCSMRQTDGAQLALSRHPLSPLFHRDRFTRQSLQPARVGGAHRMKARMGDIRMRSDPARAGSGNPYRQLQVAARVSRSRRPRQTTIHLITGSSRMSGMLLLTHSLPSALLVPQLTHSPSRSINERSSFITASQSDSESDAAPRSSTREHASAVAAFNEAHISAHRAAGVFTVAQL